MASWKQESEVYKTRMYEKYGIIEEKFDKQAFNNDPIAYFESINYELHGTEWISAMWNLLKLAKTDSKLIKKQLGPNGQKVVQILAKILLKNPNLASKVESKIGSITPQVGSQYEQALMTEKSLARYDRILEDDLLEEKLGKGAKITIIVVVIAILITIGLALLGANGAGNNIAAEVGKDMPFSGKLKILAQYPLKSLKYGGQIAWEGVKNAGASAVNSVKNLFAGSGKEIGQAASQVSNVSIPPEATDIIHRISQAVSNNSDKLATLQDYVNVRPGVTAQTTRDIAQSTLQGAFAMGKIDMGTLQTIAGSLGL